MLGNRIHESIEQELEKRKNALDRTKYKDAIASDDTSQYGFDEMSIRTTYVSLISPLYAAEGKPLPTIQGRMLDPSNNTSMTSNFPLSSPLSYNHYEAEYYLDNRDGRGYVPPPGITSVRTSYIGEGATLNTMKEADITLRLFSRGQYNYIVPRFVRVGTPLYLEFGWTNAKLEANRLNKMPREFLQYDPELSGLNAISINYEELNNYPDEFSRALNGNTDLLYGIVRRYDVKMMEDGGFEINLNLITEGHALYSSDTDRDGHSNIKLYKPNQGEGVDPTLAKAPFHHHQDVRNGLILLGKAKAILQDDFGLTDAFRGSFYKPWEPDNQKVSTDNVPQASHYYYNDAKDTISLVKELRLIPGVEVEEIGSKTIVDVEYQDRFNNSPSTGGFGLGGIGEWSQGKQEEAKKQEKVIADHDYIIIYFPNTPDLIITMNKLSGKHKVPYTQVPLKDGKANEKAASYESNLMMCMKINYYVSGRYLEDNLISRLFGTVNKNGTLLSGVRSLHSDDGSTILASNKMLTHRFLVPKNFDDILINTEAMRAMLTKTQTGLHDFKGAKKQSYDKFKKKLAEVLTAHPNFIDEEQEGAGRLNNIRDDYLKNPNHVPARIRHMFINIELVQEGFLGSKNVGSFCQRQVFPSNAGVTTERTDSIFADVDAVNLPAFAAFNPEMLGSDNLIFFFLENEKRFSPNGCADSVREGLNNTFHTIASNFHNFPNFEVGGNPTLPGFLQVYDLRYSKPSGFYEFEVFSSNSIIKNLEFNSKIPKNIELAATFGASTSLKLDSILGGRDAGLDDDFLYGLDRKIEKTTSDVFRPQDKMRGMSWNQSDYMNLLMKEIGDGFVKAQQEEAANRGEISSLQYNPDPMGSVNVAMVPDEGGGTTMAQAINDEAEAKKSDGSNVLISEAAKAFPNIKTLKLSNTDIPPYSMWGITNNFIEYPESKHANTKNDSEQERKIRDMFPNLNEGLSLMSDQVNKIFTMSSDTYTKDVTIASNPDAKGKTISGQGQVSVNAETGAIKNPIVSRSGRAYNATLQFTTTYGEVLGKDNGYKSHRLAFGTHADYQGYIDFLINQDERNALKALSGTVSYFELSLTIDGIAGILPGEAFTISYLPDLISDYFYFIVKNVEQNLTETGWETIITALQRRRYNTAEDLKTMVIQMNKLKIKQKKKIDPPIDMKDLFPPPETKLPKELDNPEPIIGTEEDQTTNVVLPPPPYPNRYPSSSLDAAELSDEELAIPDFDDSFEDFKFDPPPPRPFLPYSFQESDTANIIMEMVDGQVSIQGLNESPRKDFKIYPNGEPNAVPVQFSLGVTDILSDKEFWSMVNAFTAEYEKLGFGEDYIKAQLRELYDGPYPIRGGEISIVNKSRTTNSLNLDDPNKMGTWDRERNFNFYIAKRTTPEGKTIVEILEEIRIAENTIGNDPENKMEDIAFGKGADNEFFDDIIYQILTEPERTKVTIIPGKIPDPPPPPPPPVVEEPEEPEEEPVLEEAAGDAEVDTKQDETPPDPIKKFSTYISAKASLSSYPEFQRDAFPEFFANGGGTFDNDLIYDIVPAWRTKLASTTSEKNDGNYKQKILRGGPGTDKKESATGSVPQEDRMYFWDTMIHPQIEDGGERDHTLIVESYKILMSPEYDYLRELDGGAKGEFGDPVTGGMPWTPRFPAIYKDKSTETEEWGGQPFNKK